MTRFNSKSIKKLTYLFQRSGYVNLNLKLVETKGLQYLALALH